MEPVLFGLFVMGATLAALSPVELRRRLAGRAAHSMHALGRVVGVERHHRSTADEALAPLLVPRVRFECDGGTHEFLATHDAATTAPAVGAAVALRYVPHHPETVELDRREEDARCQRQLVLAGLAGLALTSLSMLIA